MNHASLAALLTPVLERHGLELDHLELVPAGRRTVLRVTVDGDGPQGRGPLLDDIAAASGDLSAALDASPEMGDRAYTLEVSSRGLGRPLTDERHYRRNVGRLVQVTTAEGRQLTGRIAEVADGQVTLHVTPEPSKGNRRPQAVVHVLDVASLGKATIQVEMNRPLVAGLDDVELGGDTDRPDFGDDDLEADEEAAEDDDAWDDTDDLELDDESDDDEIDSDEHRREDEENH